MSRDQNADLVQLQADLARVTAERDEARADLETEVADHLDCDRKYRERAEKAEHERDEARDRERYWSERAQGLGAKCAQMRAALTAHCCREFGPPVRSSVSEAWVHTATPTGRLVCSSHALALAPDALADPKPEGDE